MILECFNLHAHLTHFLPPGVDCTTGRSHNLFTWRPLEDGKNAKAKKLCYEIICKINTPSATLVFPTILL